MSQNGDVEEAEEGGEEGGDSDEDPTQKRKIQSIELPNEGHGFGFGVISTANERTIVHSILPGGIAEKVRGRGGGRERSREGGREGERERGREMTCVN